jgi:hypothetical protein
VSSNPAPFSGTLASQSNIVSGLHQHYFSGTTNTFSINTGERLIAYVYLDPANLPTEVMLQWKDSSTGWEHRAYWGANNVLFGVDGGNARRFMGPLPPAGQWVRLEVPASLVGLEGQTLNGMAFTLFNGRATWDHAGKSSTSSPTPTPTPTPVPTPTSTPTPVPSPTPTATPTPTPAPSPSPNPSPGPAPVGFYVATNGSPSGNGSITQPWDLQTALNQPSSVPPGAAIYLRGGIYTGKFVSNLTGTVSSPITVRPYPGESVKIDGYATTVLSTSIDSITTTITVVDASKITIGSVISVHDQLTESAEEQIHISGKSGNVLSIERGWNGTTSKTHNAGVLCVLGGNQLTVNGSDAIYRDFEITNSDPVRSWGTSVNGQNAPHLRGEGVWHAGARTKLVNLIIHDVQDGIFSPPAAVDVETYGCVIYNNGYLDANGPAGHGWYIQNNAGSTKTYRGNISFNNQNFGAQEESVSGNTVNVINDGLVIFGNPFLVGAQNGIVDNVTFTNGFFYERGIAGLRMGYGGANGLGTVTNNYFGGISSGALLSMPNWSTVTISGNTFALKGGGDLVQVITSPGNYTVNNNSYFDTTTILNCVGGNARATFGFNGVEGLCGGNLKFPEWQASSGFDSGSNYNTTAAPTSVTLRPNAYQAGRANLVIYNWSLAPSVSVNLSTSGLVNGQNYEIRNAQNYFGPPVLAGTYNSASPTVSLPMTSAASIAIAQPFGSDLSARTTTLPEFGAFVIVPN